MQLFALLVGAMAFCFSYKHLEGLPTEDIFKVLDSDLIFFVDDSNATLYNTIRKTPVIRDEFAAFSIDLYPTSVRTRDLKLLITTLCTTSIGSIGKIKWTPTMPSGVLTCSTPLHSLTQKPQEFRTYLQCVSQFRTVRQPAARQPAARQSSAPCSNLPSRTW